MYLGSSWLEPSNQGNRGNKKNIFSLIYAFYGYGSVNVDLSTDNIKHFSENIGFNLTCYRILAIYARMLRFFDIAVK